MKLLLKHLALGLAAAAASLAAVPLHAQPNGDKPLRIVVPFAPGGAQDVIARYLGAKPTDKLGGSVIVDNKAGAGGIVAADAVAKATDGATVLLATGSAITIAPHLQAKRPYDPVHDLMPVALVGDAPMTVAVRTDSPYRTLADVLRDAKARPGQVSYASTGNGTVSHLTGALLAQASGKARVLGTFSRAALPSLGTPPTVAEAAGLAGMDVPVWVGVMAPVRMPAASIEKLSAALGKVIAEDSQRWAKVIKQGGIKID